MKKIMTFAALLLAAVLLASCGGENPSPANQTSDGTKDTTAVTASVVIREPRALAAEINSRCKFGTPLEENADFTKNKFADLAGILNDCTGYVTSATTAQEIFVFEAKTADDAKAVAERLENYCERQQMDFGDYMPSEVPYLEDAVILADGNLVVYVVCEDNAAALEIVNGLIK